MTSHGNTDNEPRRDRWKAPGSEVSTFLFEEEKKMSLPYAFNQHHPSLSCPCTRDSHVHVYVYNTFYGLYTRETLYTQKIIHTEQKKRNTIILYSQSAFCLQFHFNLLFVNLPSARESLTYMRAKKDLKKKDKRETTSTPLLLICKFTEK